MCGDKITITLVPVQLSAYSYEVRYTFNYQQSQLSTSSSGERLADNPAKSEPLATALTRHVCIDKTTRKKHPIDRRLTDWLMTLTASAVIDD